MKIFFFLTLFLLQSCSSYNEIKSFNFDVSENITFKEFEIKLDEYEKNSQYPNINN